MRRPFQPIDRRQRFGVAKSDIIDRFKAGFDQLFLRCAKRGLNVQIVQGGPGVNVPQLLASGAVGIRESSHRMSDKKTPRKP